MKKYLVDTNVLLDSENLDSLKDFDIVITDLVLYEIENLERKKLDKALQYSIRVAKRWIRDNVGDFDLTSDVNYELDYDADYVDNKLLQVCVDRSYGLISNDLLIKYKAKCLNIEILEIEEQNNFVEYKGFKDVWLTDKEYKDLYQNLDVNTYDLKINEGLVIYDMITGDLLDILSWNGKCLITINRKGFSTKMFGSVKPYDPYQALFIHSIMNNKVTMVKSNAGTGKTFLSLATAWNLIEKGKYDKLYVFYNFTKLKNSNELGFYKGDKITKIMQNVPFLKNKFGGELELEFLINAGTLIVEPFSDIRGMDIGSNGEKALVYIVEAQNLTKDLMRIGLERIGDDAKVIIDGDWDNQIDNDVYKYDNGMKRLSEIMRGNHMYGEVHLQYVYRSELAELVQEM